MYLIYDTDQIAYGEKGLLEEAKTDPSLQHQHHRPTWVVRTSDMKRVPGSEATDGYCALSYSWAWLGERIKNEETGKEDLVDRGKHQIIMHYKGGNSKTTSSPTILRCHVKFEDVLQQICKDFGIDYIWYDRWCVNIDDEAEKVEEIKQMYLNYSNARYAVALVPEMAINNISSKYTDDDADQQQYIQNLKTCLDQIIQCEWSTRVWLLAEAMASKRILYVGKNVHVWSDGLDQYAAAGTTNNTLTASLEAIQSLSSKGANDACKVLWHAHRRHTSIDHDRIFALINIYFGSPTPIALDITYDIPLSTYMIQFYSKLATIDLSILCFGKQQEGYPSSVQKYSDFLPSWTGVAGTHTQHASMRQLQLEINYDVDEVRGRMYIRQCNSITVSLQPYVPIETADETAPSSLVATTELGQRYGITFTHHHSFNSDDDKRKKYMLFSATQDCLKECTVLDIPFVWQDCVIRPVVALEQKINNSHNDDGDDNVLLYKSIGIAVIPNQYYVDNNGRTVDQPASVTLENFAPVSNTTIIIE